MNDQAPYPTRPGFFIGVAGAGLNYSLVISIMFACAWVGSWSDCRVGAPGSTLRPGPFMIVGMGGVVVRSARGWP